LTREIILKNDTKKILVPEISITFTNILALKMYVSNKIMKFEFDELI